MRGPTWWLFGFLTASFPLDCIRPSRFLSCAFGCLDCPWWLLVKARPSCWFCCHLVTPGRDSLTCKAWYQSPLSLNPAQPHRVVKFRPIYGDLSRLRFYLEDFVFHALRQETHWPLLESCPRCFVHCSPPCFFRTECPSWLSLWPLWRNSRAFVLLYSIAVVSSVPVFSVAVWSSHQSTNRMGFCFFQSKCVVIVSSSCDFPTRGGL